MREYFISRKIFVGDIIDYVVLVENLIKFVSPRSSVVLNISHRITKCYPIREKITEK